jgi:hypothetical protein
MDNGSPESHAAYVAHQRFKIGQVLTEAFDTYSNNFLKFLGVACMAFAPLLMLMNYAFLGGDTASDLNIAEFNRTIESGEFWIGFAVIFSFSFLSGIFVQTAITYASVEYRVGKPSGFFAMITVAFKNIVPVIGITILLILLYMVVLAIFGLFSAIFPGIIKLFIIVLGFFSLIAISLGVCVAVPALVSEDIGFIEAIGRSYMLTRGHKWGILGVFFLVGLISMFVSFVLGAMAAFASGIILALIQLVGYAFSASFTGVLIASIYTNLRMSKDGIGVDDLAKVFE